MAFGPRLEEPGANGENLWLIVAIRAAVRAELWKTVGRDYNLFAPPEHTNYRL
jgi:hypothetical protein